MAEGLPDNEQFILLHDNATSQTANDTKNWLDRNNIMYLRDFPPYSLDLNPVENVWAALKRYLSIHPASSLEDLWENVNMFWDGMNLNFINTLINSITNRLNNVLKSKGRETAY